MRATLTFASLLLAAGTTSPEPALNVTDGRCRWYEYCCNFGTPCICNWDREAEEQCSSEAFDFCCGSETCCDCSKGSHHSPIACAGIGIACRTLFADATTSEVECSLEDAGIVAACEAAGIDSEDPLADACGSFIRTNMEAACFAAIRADGHFNATQCEEAAGCDSQATGTTLPSQDTGVPHACSPPAEINSSSLFAYSSCLQETCTDGASEVARSMFGIVGGCSEGLESLKQMTQIFGLELQGCGARIRQIFDTEKQIIAEQMDFLERMVIADLCCGSCTCACRCQDGTEPNNEFSACIQCPSGRAGTGGRCFTCRDGREPSSDHTDCVDCPAGSAGTLGMCNPCLLGSKPNSDQTACTCPDGLTSQNNHTQCAKAPPNLIAPFELVLPSAISLSAATATIMHISLRRCGARRLSIGKYSTILTIDIVVDATAYFLVVWERDLDFARGCGCIKMSLLSLVLCSAILFAIEGAMLSFYDKAYGREASQKLFLYWAALCVSVHLGFLDTFQLQLYLVVAASQATEGAGYSRAATVAIFQAFFLVVARCMEILDVDPFRLCRKRGTGGVTEAAGVAIRSVSTRDDDLDDDPKDPVGSDPEDPDEDTASASATGSTADIHASSGTQIDIEIIEETTAPIIERMKDDSNPPLATRETSMDSSFHGSSTCCGC